MLFHSNFQDIIRLKKMFHIYDILVLDFFSVTLKFQFKNSKADCGKYIILPDCIIQYQ